MRTQLIMLPVAFGLAFASAHAEENTTHKPDPAGYLIDENGQKWVVEGCAAYPVTDEAAPRTFSAWTPKKTPKQSKPARTF